jgi:type IV secretory pathway ATPase VirB11/archaellum biosynthesis ATPase
LHNRERSALEQVELRFSDAHLSRPRTRAGAVERVQNGLPERFQSRIEELGDHSPAGRRRLGYHVLASLRSLGPLTPLALDDRVQIADTSEAQLVVHTRDFAPAKTELPVETPHLERFLGERVTQRTIPFAGFDVPVTVVRGHLLGADTSEVSYVIDEPDLLPGDEALIETVGKRILEAPPEDVLEDEGQSVRKRARTLLSRRLKYQPVAKLRDYLSNLLGQVPLVSATQSNPTTSRSRSERIDALAYYVTRDLAGDGKLTVPMRDPAVRSIEANRVGDRIAIVTHRGESVGNTRMPTTLAIDTLTEFVDIARSLSADGGVELSVTRPAATVTVTRETAAAERTLHCSVSLPTKTESGHVSITAKRERPPSPIALVQQNQLTAPLVAGIWTTIVNRGTVVFLGPVDAEPTVALESHTPFIPVGERPVVIGQDAAGIDIPHETALTVSRSESADTQGATSLEQDALHPDVALLPGINTHHGIGHLATSIASGRPVIAAARTATRGLLSQLVRTADVEHQFGSQVDLVVELPPPESDESATGWLPLRAEALEEQADGPSGVERTAGLAWTRFRESDAESTTPALSPHFVSRLAGDNSTERTGLEQTFSRRVQYVNYLDAAESTDRESLMSFLADLRTDEAATIERIQTQ